ncbi:drug:proton antiporter [Thioclava dalianensis]|uniref:Drug:proton antiporter n=1 Tax=Thioclava dalianensis TaxID=1185766 RepID=A0A074TGD2_9RHOB|nr:GNAT family N-acetyltransferase [Thioclava dalianensis]KEP69185.1 drug:proton antiporter [Thioclava dalianensis]SFM91672.1 ElaA protein [Thioclava dalianensis]
MIIEQVTDFAPCHALRRAVFIEEQGIAEPDEWDDLDVDAIHLLAHEEDTPLGTARLIRVGETGKIGRICVVREARGTGLGAALVRESCARLREIGCTRAYLSAQCYAIGFYERLGFAAYGAEYDDAGIAHKDMEMAL